MTKSQHESQYTVNLTYTLKGRKGEISLQGHGQEDRDALIEAEDALLDIHPKAKDIQWTSIYLTEGYDIYDR